MMGQHEGLLPRTSDRPPLAEKCLWPELDGNTLAIVPLNLLPIFKQWVLPSCSTAGAGSLNERKSEYFKLDCKSLHCLFPEHISKWISEYRTCHGLLNVYWVKFYLYHGTSLPFYLFICKMGM